MRPPLQTAGFGNIGLSLLSMFQVVSAWWACSFAWYRGITLRALLPTLLAPTELCRRP